ncbi:MAG: ketol-acid reductoisomerase [Phycisphaerales bacterium]|nr:ketol-acid reductoisomerase [Phycisphaerales bacterium]
MSLSTVADNGSLLDALRSRTVAVIGYGNQGEAHALNLRDSGIAVIVGSRAGSDSGQRAAAHGFPVMSIPQSVARADLVVVGLPDEIHGAVFAESIAPALRPDAVVGFIHGFSVRYQRVHPPRETGVVLVAPKGPGATLRERFVQGTGIPCLFAVHQDNPSRTAEAIGLAWASGIGCGRARIVRSSFADETETDLFGEQAVLCGGLSALVVAAFEILVEAGYPEELAYIECCHEVKQVADLVYTRGPAGMRKAISNTAEFGAYRAGPRLVDDSVRDRMRQLLAEVRNGTFAKAMADDQAAGFPWFEAQRREGAAHPIERASETVRGWMERKGDGER